MTDFKPTMPEVTGFSREFEYTESVRKRVTKGWIDESTLTAEKKRGVARFSREEAKEKLLSLYRKAEIRNDEPNVIHFKFIPSANTVGKRMEQNLYTDGKVVYKVKTVSFGGAAGVNFLEAAEVTDATWVIFDHYNDVVGSVVCFTKASEKEVLESIEDVIDAVYSEE